MKLLLVAALALFTVQASAQKTDDKSKRPSPPATVKEKLASGVEITIEYSQPSIKGRTIGKDLEPMPGKVWRAGANEATTFEFSENVNINGNPLAKGKYSFFTIADGNAWTIIFNKVATQWGAYKYSEQEDALRVSAKSTTSKEFHEKLTFTVAKNGTVTLWWGDIEMPFTVE